MMEGIYLPCNETELSSQEKLRVLKEELNNKCVKLKEILKSILGIEHEDILKNT